MAAAKFGVGDTVRFIGTDMLLAVTRYRKATHNIDFSTVMISPAVNGIRNLP
jgi:hypothetical protein